MLLITWMETCMQARRSLLVLLFGLGAFTESAALAEETEKERFILSVSHLV